MLRVRFKLMLLRDEIISFFALICGTALIAIMVIHSVPSRTVNTNH